MLDNATLQITLVTTNAKNVILPNIDMFATLDFLIRPVYVVHVYVHVDTL